MPGLGDTRPMLVDAFQFGEDAGTEIAQHGDLIAGNDLGELRGLPPAVGAPDQRDQPGLALDLNTEQH